MPDKKKDICITMEIVQFSTNEMESKWNVVCLLALFTILHYIVRVDINESRSQIRTNLTKSGLLKYQKVVHFLEGVHHKYLM